MALLQENLYQDIVQFCTRNTASRSFIQEFARKGIGDHICAAHPEYGCLIRSSSQHLYVLACTQDAPQDFTEMLIQQLYEDEQTLRMLHHNNQPEEAYRLEVCAYLHEAAKNRIRDHYQFKDYCSVQNVSYLAAKPPRYELAEHLSIQRLDESYLDCVCEHYTKINDRAYLLSCLRDRYCYGIFENGNIAGFIGEHGEGTMGLLEIFPDFRRKGYAYLLESYAIEQQLLRGNIAVAHIVLDNAASFALQKKLGMKLGDEIIHWIGY